MAKNYKSRTFMTGFTEWEHFRTFMRDISSINELKLKQQSLEDFFEQTIRYLYTKSKNEESRILQNLIDAKYVIDKTQFDSFARITKFFSELFIGPDSKDESIDNLIHDISIESDTDGEKFELIRSLLAITKKRSPQYEIRKKSEKTKAGIMPYLSGFNSTVEIRGEFNKEFEIGDDIEEYKKKLKIEKSINPIISVNISLDSGTPDNFSFQASPDNIKLLIDELQAALHRSEVFESQIKIK